MKNVNSKVLLLNIEDTISIFYEGAMYREYTPTSSYISYPCGICDLIFICYDLIDTSICESISSKYVNMNTDNISFVFNKYVTIDSLFMACYMRMHSYEL